MKRDVLGRPARCSTAQLKVSPAADHDASSRPTGLERAPTAGYVTSGDGESPAGFGTRAKPNLERDGENLTITA
jgi:hypothetical protein